jgi:hypothetical protein
VKSTEAACPFCRTALDLAPPPPVPRAIRASRATLLAVGATAILGAAGCSSDDSAPTQDAAAIDATADSPSVQALYGAAAIDATADSPSVQALYGAAAIDATADSPSVQALYGAVALLDAGEPKDAADDHVTVVALYGGSVPGH